MPGFENSAIAGIVAVDGQARQIAAVGLGADPRIRSLVADAQWMKELRQRRLSVLNLDRKSYAVLLAPLRDGHLLVLSDGPGDTVLNFIGSVDFAWDIFRYLLTDPFDAMTVVDKDARVVHISPVHEAFFGLKPGEGNGRPVERIIDNLATLRPTIMGAAPRIFEKAHARIEGMVAEQSRLTKKMFDLAIGIGMRVSEARQAGKKPSLVSSLAYKVADRLVFSTIRERFGGRVRFFVSAAAALDRDVAQWFDAVGITVLEGYGLTETAAASLINRPNAYRFGTAGRPFRTDKHWGD